MVGDTGIGSASGGAPPRPSRPLSLGGTLIAVCWYGSWGFTDEADLGAVPGSRGPVPRVEVVNPMAAYRYGSWLMTRETRGSPLPNLGGIPTAT